MFAEHGASDAILLRCCCNACSLWTECGQDVDKTFTWHAPWRAPCAMAGGPSASLSWMRWPCDPFAVVSFVTVVPFLLKLFFDCQAEAATCSAAVVVKRESWKRAYRLASALRVLRGVRVCESCRDSKRPQAPPRTPRGISLNLSSISATRNTISARFGPELSVY